MSTSNTPKIKAFRRKIAAGGIEKIDALGSFWYLKEATGPVLVRMDEGDDLPYDVGTGVNAKTTGTFNYLVVSNPGPDEVTVIIYAGLGEIIDNRFTLVTDRNSALKVAADDPNSATPPTIQRVEIVANGAIQQLLAADTQRGEVWLWTDETASLAWWAESAAGLASPQEFQKIGLNLEGLTKLRTKSSIFVTALAGVKIGAVVFKS